VDASSRDLLLLVGLLARSDPPIEPALLLNGVEDFAFVFVISISKRRFRYTSFSLLCSSHSRIAVRILT